ncbi:MAG: CinA family protein, partial [Chlamydiales bacterium]
KRQRQAAVRESGAGSPHSKKNHNFLLGAMTVQKIKRIQAKLVENNKTLAFAESCTGGRMAALVTAIPGASSYFLGSIVCYADALKRDLLHVPEELLQTRGAVSKEVVSAMLKGLFEVTAADYGIAVSGIAGPSGGTPEKPIGTVCAAIGMRGNPSQVFTFHAQGKTRDEVILATCAHLFDELEKILRA